MDCRVCQGFSHAVVCGPCVANTRARHQARHLHLTTELHDARARATAAVLDPTRTTTTTAAAARAAAQVRIEALAAQLAARTARIAALQSQVATDRANLQARRAALNKRQADLAAARAKVPARLKHAIERAKRHLRAVEAPAANAHHVLVQELVRVFRFRCDEGKEPTILGVPLAASGDVMAVISHTDADNKTHDAERLNAALAHTAQLVNLMAMYLNVHLPFDLDAVPSRAVARVHYHPPPSTSSTTSANKKPAISPTSTVSASMLGFSNFLQASTVVDPLGTARSSTTTDAAPIYFSPASGAEEFAVGLAMLNYQVLHLCAAVGVPVRRRQIAHTLANLSAAIDAVRRNRAGGTPGEPTKRVKVVPFRTVLNVVTKRIQKHEAELGFRFVRRVSGGSNARAGGTTRAAAAADVDTGDEATVARRVSGGGAATGLPGPASATVGKSEVRPSDLDTVFTVVFPLDMDSDDESSDEDDEEDEDDDETDDPASDDDVDNDDVDDCATEVGTREPAAGTSSPASVSLPRARSSTASDTPVVPPDRLANDARASPPTPTAPLRPPENDNDDDWELDLDTHVPTDVNAGQDAVTPARLAAAARAVWEEGRRSLSRSPAPHSVSRRHQRLARDPFDLLDSAAPDMAASVTAADLLSPVRGRSRSRTRRAAGAALPAPLPPPPPPPPAADASPSPSPTDTMGVLSGILTWGGYVVRKSLGGAAAAAAVASFGPDDRDDEAEKRAFLTGSSLAKGAPAGVPIPAPAARRRGQVCRDGGD
ncbi:hypothetical protein GGF31_000592 [Allomyces arbusculus]|nr:hypothetical protein GGF31_000592 [Allomyces arbusculus]